jgi:hypothetical protein
MSCSWGNKGPSIPVTCHPRHLELLLFGSDVPQSATCIFNFNLNYLQLFFAHEITKHVVQYLGGVLLTRNLKSRTMALLPVRICWKLYTCCIMLTRCRILASLPARICRKLKIGFFSFSNLLVWLMLQEGGVPYQK